MASDFDRPGICCYISLKYLSAFPLRKVPTGCTQLVALATQTNGILDLVFTIGSNQALKPINNKLLGSDHSQIHLFFGVAVRYFLPSIHRTIISWNLMGLSAVHNSWPKFEHFLLICKYPTDCQPILRSSRSLP